MMASRAERDPAANPLLPLTQTSHQTSTPEGGSEAKDNESWNVWEGSSATEEGSSHLLPSSLFLNHSRLSVSAVSFGGRAAICLALQPECGQVNNASARVHFPA